MFANLTEFVCFQIVRLLQSGRNISLRQYNCFSTLPINHLVTTCALVQIHFTSNFFVLIRDNFTVQYNSEIAFFALSPESLCFIMINRPNNGHPPTLTNFRPKKIRSIVPFFQENRDCLKSKSSGLVH